jgi:hypothetical protein
LNDVNGVARFGASVSLYGGFVMNVLLKKSGMLRFFGAVMVLAYVYSPPALAAGCKMRHLRGVWQDFALAHDANAVGHCSFVLDREGSISVGSVCSNYTATSDIPPIAITSGYFVIDASCAIKGSVGGGNGVNAFFQGQMDKSRNSFTGISRNSGGVVTLHNFVKQ